MWISVFNNAQGDPPPGATDEQRDLELRWVRVDGL
jgi:hypothetical protein